MYIYIYICIYIYTYGDIWFVGRSTLTLGMFFVSLEDISFSTRGGRGFLLSSIIWSHKSSSGERLQGLGPGTGLFQLLLKCENHLGEFSGQKLVVNIAILPLYSGCWEQACVLQVNSQRHGQKLDSKKKHIGVFIYIYTHTLYIHRYIHACIHTSIHPFIHPYIHITYPFWLTFIPYKIGNYGGQCVDYQQWSDDHNPYPSIYHAMTMAHMMCLLIPSPEY